MAVRCASDPVLRRLLPDHHGLEVHDIREAGNIPEVAGEVSLLTAPDVADVAEAREGGTRPESLASTAQLRPYRAAYSS